MKNTSHKIKKGFIVKKIQLKTNVTNRNLEILCYQGNREQPDATTENVKIFCCKTQLGNYTILQNEKSLITVQHKFSSIHSPWNLHKIPS